MTLRITSWNVNGLRQALRKGAMQTIERIDPQVLLLQELKGPPEKLDVADRAPPGWHIHWNPAVRQGYSGTAVWSRAPVEALDEQWGEGPDADEGRIAMVRTQGMVISSVYLPNGDSSRKRQGEKERWMAWFLPWAHRQLERFDEPMVLGGDLNIAHTRLDIQRPGKRSGFLPNERQWFDELLAGGWIDLQRRHFGQVDGPYSWWRARQKERAVHSGWRIDYLLGNEKAATALRGAGTLTEAGQGISDHAPISVDLEFAALQRVSGVWFDENGYPVPR